MNQPIVGQKYRYLGEDSLLELYDDYHLVHGYLNYGDVVVCQETRTKLDFKINVLTTEFAENMFEVYGYEWDELFHPYHTMDADNPTLSIFHVADLLEDALFADKNPSIVYERQQMYDMIKLTVETLRREGF